MDIERILEWLSTNFLQIIVIASIFIQISPIKWNPITSFITWFGSLITKDIADKLDDLTDDVVAIQEQVDENEKDRIRWEILNFANSCRNNCKHTKDEFQHIISLNDKYKKLLELTDDTNGVFEVEYEYIQQLYHDRQIKNDFL